MSRDNAPSMSRNKAPSMSRDNAPSKYLDLALRSLIFWLKICLWYLLKLWCYHQKWPYYHLFSWLIHCKFFFQVQLTYLLFWFSGVLLTTAIALWCAIKEVRYNFRITKGRKAPTAWKVSKYRVFSGPYFPAFGLNTERYFVSLPIHSKWGKIRTRKYSVFGHFSHSVSLLQFWLYK